MKELSSGTAQGLIAFLDVLVDKGRLSKGQANPLKIAVTKVLSAIDGETWGQTAIREIDVEDYMGRFPNKTTTFYNDDSLRTYRSRVARAVQWYKNFLDNPGWVPTLQTGRVVRKDEAVSSGTKAPADAALPNGLQPALVKTENTSKAVNIFNAPGEGELTTYPFPLSGGQLARLSLPFKLSVEDIERLKKFLDSLQFGD